MLLYHPHLCLTSQKYSYILSSYNPSRNQICVLIQSYVHIYDLLRPTSVSNQHTPSSKSISNGLLSYYQPLLYTFTLSNEIHYSNIYPNLSQTI
jgi:hypothetical protein